MARYLSLTLLCVITLRFFLSAQNQKVEEIRSYAFPMDKSEQRFYDHYNGENNRVYAETTREINSVGYDSDGNYSVQLREFMQMKSGALKGVIAVKKLIVAEDGIHYKSLKVYNSPLKNTGTSEYQGNGPVIFKLPKAGGIVNYSYVDNGVRYVFTSEYSLIPIQNKTVKAVKITSTEYNRQGKVIASSRNSYYVQGVGLWKVTVGPKEKLYMKLRNPEAYLRLSQINIVNDKNAVAESSGAKPPSKITNLKKGKAMMPKRNREESDTSGFFQGTRSFCSSDDIWIYVVTITGDSIVLKSFPGSKDTYYTDKTKVKETVLGKISGDKIITKDAPEYLTNRFKFETGILYEINNEDGYNNYEECK